MTTDSPTPTPPQEACREAFEAEYAKHRPGACFDRETIAPNCYKWNHVHVAWLSWQACDAWHRSRHPPLDDAGVVEVVAHAIAFAKCSGIVHPSKDQAKAALAALKKMGGVL